MARKMTPLKSELIVRKGEAVPASSPGVSANNAASNANDSSRVGKVRGGTIAITVRLDPDRYNRLKGAGVRRGLTNQEIMVTALDRWFREEGAS
jgi:hypothetical protein